MIGDPFDRLEMNMSSIAREMVSGFSIMKLVSSR